MKHAIALTTPHFESLDLSPAQQVIDPILTNAKAAQSLSDPKLIFSFEINFPRQESDPRELSEIPEVRLWFIRLNAQYPWLPLYLDWESGELSRYTAMLVPHQFSTVDGIRYNPEALEIFVMSKVFVLDTWLKSQGIDGRARLKFMTQMLGYELDDALFSLLS
ncbi:MAG: NdhI maturation protein [Phormidesmis priestleyi Ana]|uniref:NdhI maturation protein n=1 Tax=Phormidesmis priestleyi Ana TaxID=1666911 RepID=A0A0P7YXC4_9CYAN|nr:MAG: NdhI maturation protein [Phormidesmis priestleyi Ana]